LRKLTIEARLTRGHRVIRFLGPLDPLEESSAPLQNLRSPELLIDIGSTRSLRPRLFEPVLLGPNPSPQLHRATQFVCVVDRVRLGLFDVSVRVLEPAFIEKQVRQVVMNPKRATVRPERGRNSESNLVMGNGLLPLALGMIYVYCQEDDDSRRPEFDSLSLG